MIFQVQSVLVCRRRRFSPDWWDFLQKSSTNLLYFQVFFGIPNKTPQDSKKHLMIEILTCARVQPRHLRQKIRPDWVVQTGGISMAVQLEADWFSKSLEPWSCREALVLVLGRFSRRCIRTVYYWISAWEIHGSSSWGWQFISLSMCIPPFCWCLIVIVVW